MKLAGNLGRSFFAKSRGDCCIQYIYTYIYILYTDEDTASRIYIIYITVYIYCIYVSNMCIYIYRPVHIDQPAVRIYSISGCLLGKSDAKMAEYF